MSGVASATPRRIGLLGGSFDPIHNAHLQLAQSACSELALDAVWFIPAGQPWQRDPLAASPQQRWDMVNLAIAGRTGLRACDIELKRQGPSYTIDTLAALRQRHPDIEFSLILGTDIRAERTRWKRFEEIERDYSIHWIGRLGHDPEGQGLILPDISSREVRRRLAAGEDVSAFVPQRVLTLVRQSGYLFE